MDARCKKILLAIAALASVAATHRTPNFVVTAATPEIATQVANAAEYYRREIAIEWLGQPLPSNWSSPCPIQVKVGQIGAGGATSFNFDRGEVYGWNMNIQGSLERILDSVLPHEVSHTIFACYFRRPLPRWADEGAATLAEHESEKRRQVLTVRQILGTTKRIPLRNLVAMKDYPPDMQDVLTLYAEGYSLAELLVQRGGKARYLAFLQDSHEKGWDTAIKTHYGYQGVDGLEKNWHEWVLAGSPAINLPAGNEFAAANRPAQSAAGQNAAPMIRGQSPEADQFAEADITATQPELPRSNLRAPAPRSKPTKQQAYAPPQASAASAHAVAPAPNTGKRRNRRRTAAAAPDVSVDLGEAADPTADETVTADLVETEQPAARLDPADDTPAFNETNDAPSTAPKFAARKKPIASKSPASRNRPIIRAQSESDDDQNVETPLDREMAEAAPFPPSKPRRTAKSRTASNNSNTQFAIHPPRRRTPQWSEFPQDQRPLPRSLRASADE